MGYNKIFHLNSIKINKNNNNNNTNQIYKLNYNNL